MAVSGWICVGIWVRRVVVGGAGNEQTVPGKAQAVGALPNFFLKEWEKCDRLSNPRSRWIAEDF